MALATTTLNIDVGPEDGWKEVVAAGATINFLDARQQPCTHALHLYIGASQPAITVRGFKITEEPVMINVVTSAVGVWVKCVSPTHNNQKARLDVIVTTA